MEMELKNIIDKIKAEGVDEAERQAADIKDRAEEAAKSALHEARDQKARILEEARKEAEKLKANGEEAIRQAARDVILGIREDMIRLFDSVVKQKISGELSPATVKEMLIKIAEGAAREKSFDIEVLLNDKDKAEMEKGLLKELEEKLKKGVTLKAAPHIENGFRIGEKGGNAYYDFTDEAIADAFRAYLNPKMLKLLTPGGEK